jgi:predicted nucleotidyltransferase
VDPRESARELVRDWQGLFGERLRSALLFGSVARGEYVEEVSDINVLLLIDQIDAATLKKASQATRKWIKTAREAPLVFEIEQWKRAADVFAIEIADMSDAHEMLHGEDPLAHAVIDEESLRLQAERELRGKLLQLQTGLLVAANTPADVGKLLLNSVPSFATYLRAVLRLAGQTAPVDTTEAINRAAGHIGVNPASFLRVWEARQKRSSFKLAVDDPMVDAYYDMAERTADFVDNLRR